MKLRTLMIAGALLFFGAPFTVEKAAAQTNEKDERRVEKTPGKIKGEIVIKNAAGNNLDEFSCADLMVSANRIDAETRRGNWSRSGAAQGKFSTRRCIYTIGDVPATGRFVVSLELNSPPCDQRSVKADASFPMQLKKGGESVTYNIFVYELRCSVAK